MVAVALAGDGLHRDVVGEAPDGDMAGIGGEQADPAQQHLERTVAVGPFPFGEVLAQVIVRDIVNRLEELDKVQAVIGQRR